MKKIGKICWYLSKMNRWQLQTYLFWMKPVQSYFKFLYCTCAFTVWKNQPTHPNNCLNNAITFCRRFWLSQRAKNKLEKLWRDWLRIYILLICSHKYLSVSTKTFTKRSCRAETLKSLGCSRVWKQGNNFPVCFQWLSSPSQ